MTFVKKIQNNYLISGLSDNFETSALVCCGPSCSCSASCGNRLPVQEAREGVIISHVPGMEFVVKTLTPIRTGSILNNNFVL